MFTESLFNTIKTPITFENRMSYVTSYEYSQEYFQPKMGRKLNKLWPPFEAEIFYNVLANFAGNGGYCVYYFSNIFHNTRGFKIGEYLVNKPLQAAGMSADNVRG